MMQWTGSISDILKVAVVAFGIFILIKGMMTDKKPSGKSSNSSSSSASSSPVSNSSVDNSQDVSAKE